MAVGKKTVVFICPHGIGDLIMTLPTVRLVAESGHRVVLLVKGAVERQVVEELLPDISIECAGRHEFPGGGLAKALRITGWLRRQKPDWILAQYGVDSLQFALLARLGGGRQRVGWRGRMSWLNTRSLTLGPLHKVLETARYLDLMGIRCTPADLDTVTLRLGVTRDPRRIVLGPGSGATEAHKRWPAARYAALARTLAGEHGMSVDVVGGPDERDLCAAIVGQADTENVHDLAGWQSIAEVLDHLAGATAVVANCNGLSHLAAAVGTPVVGLYGPTDAAKTGPYTPRFIRVSLDLDCAPCYHRDFIRGCGNPVCMTDLSADSVTQAVLHTLAG